MGILFAEYLDSESVSKIYSNAGGGKEKEECSIPEVLPVMINRGWEEYSRVSRSSNFGVSQYCRASKHR